MNYQTPDRLLSIVAPCFNEAEGLEAFHTALTTAVASLPYDVEIIYVDDGSTDATPQVLARLRARDARVRTLTFSRNFGHQAALLAGLDAARGGRHHARQRPAASAGTHPGTRPGVGTGG